MADDTRPNVGGFKNFAGVQAVAIDSRRALRYVTAFAVVLLLIARRPDSLFHAQLWAEDGRVFYMRELVTGGARTLVTPYAGYLQLVPRVVSVVAGHIPARFVPVLYALVAYAILVWACSLFVDLRFGALVPSPVMRFMVCCAIAVVPPGE